MRVSHRRPRQHLFVRDYRGSVVRVLNRDGTARDVTATNYEAFGTPGTSPVAPEGPLKRHFGCA